MKILKLLVIVFIIPISSSCQSIDLLEAKSMINELGLFDTGENGREILFQLEKISNEELSILMMKGNSLEKLYSFWEYSKRDKSDYRKYFSLLVSDTSKVNHQQVGCLIFPPKEAGSYIFSIAENLGDRYGIYKTYPHYLDSMALAVTFYPGIRGNINCRLMNFKAPQNLYQKIREKAKSGNVSATIGLSSYQNENDISIIKKHLEVGVQTNLYGLMCVEKFPHKSFEKDVLALFDSNMNREYPMIFSLICEVLMKYDSPQIEKALNNLISNPDEYYFQIVGLWLSFEKMEEYDHPIRKKLIAEVGEKEIMKRIEEYKKGSYYKMSKKENKK